MLGQVLTWAYCLNLPDAALLVLLLSAGFLFLKAFLGQKRWWKPVLVGLLLVGIVAIVYVTIGNRGGDHLAAPSLIPFHSYREVRNGGNPEIYRSNFMNVLLFYPAGLLAASLLPNKWHPVWCVLLVTVVFSALSAGVECLQYAHALGRVEIDDVIHNGLGALLGSLVGAIPIQSR